VLLDIILYQYLHHLLNPIDRFYLLLLILCGYLRYQYIELDLVFRENRKLGLGSDPASYRGMDLHKKSENRGDSRKESFYSS
jgi:hypothetical protein